MSISEEVPSTPPNICDPSPTVSQSAHRESSRIRTPVVKPGYVCTNGDSRCTLVAHVPPNQTQISAQLDNRIEVESDPEVENAPESNRSSDELVRKKSKAINHITQSSARTGQEVIIDIAQDLDDENLKVSVQQ
ncbi:hypothetical protein PtA15_10A224 [Puccinia triticina]|uniref:Uncharacterized protein n=1 Tax=Puccinia triticina TaxID=208348 RepID=A0ABY7CU74_9BASI|nr:uncharacterized protein PtA15_10A224 [Puccinia triticina]WAQ88804.1 hypothetical protein PtA15_10A224 [Puccinia triticina]